jgi:hypothetical protein
MTENYVETLEKKTFDGYQPGKPGFDQKITVLTQNGLKLIFYLSRHGLTRIDPVDSVLVENDGFDPKRPETHFYPGRHGLTRWTRFLWKDAVDSRKVF